MSLKLDQSFKSDDFLKEADCVRTKVQFSYIDDISQYNIDTAEIEDQVGYLTEGLEGIVSLLSGEAVLAIELPNSVNLEITETAPGIKGATVTGRTKPATLSTGLEVQVP